jgi:hypothetical protein
MLIFFFLVGVFSQLGIVCGVFDSGVVCRISVIDVTCVVGVTGVASIILGDWFSLFVGWSKKAN